ncbi:hypothetical protein E4665_15785 [Sporolactobacillus shoreae]|uniref:DUF2746 domain-containing protein n=1 Tax=Sporolactobacillus shoreae TaxID=1465501 RepID=A0A4Z0GI54_9BACL|nr:hypothetical protein [Sporolactobacillus shoreae]TGA96415.1 hypothetical protein E4665_15785 [Sporolactobacillus shoreae]
MLGIIATAIALIRRFVVRPLTKFISDTVKDYIEPLTKAITDNTNSLNLAKVEHKQLGKRLDVVEGTVRDHGERIKNVEERLK